MRKFKQVLASILCGIMCISQALPIAAQENGFIQEEIDMTEETVDLTEQAETGVITLNRCVRKSFRSILSGTQPVHYRAGVDIEYEIHHYGRPGKLYI